MDILATLCVASLIVLIFLFVQAYRYVHKYRNVFKQMGLAELPYKGWLGAWWLYWRRKGNLFQLEIDLIQTYGKFFGFFEGHYPAIMLGDASMAKQVMIKDHEHFTDRRVFFQSRDEPMNLQLTNLTGVRWKHVRQQLTPAFTPANLRRMTPLLHKVANQLVANIGKMADDNEPFDVKEYAGFFTLDSIASVAFALEIDSFNNQQSPFVIKARQAFSVVPFNGDFFALAMLFPDFVAQMMRTLPIWAMISKVVGFFQDAVACEMERRRETGENAKRNDFLAHVMPLERDVKDPANEPYVRYDEFGGIWLSNGLTRDEIYGQAVLFFIAGYETTSDALTMTLLALSQNPDIQDRLFRELAAVFCSEKTQEITMEAFKEAKYLEMVINESLRMYCPVLRIDRISTAETELNGFRIPKGIVTVIPVNAIHHDPDYWPEPDKFDPERFSIENEGSLPKDAFLPFGAGNRNCIAMRLALLELKIALTRLLLEFNFKVSPETKFPLQWKASPLRTSEDPIKLIAERRQHVAPAL